MPLSRGFSSRVRVGSGHRRGLAYLWKASSYFLDKFPYMLRVLLGRLQLPCPCLACLFVSFRSVCFRAPQTSCVWWEPFFGLAQIFGLPALSAQSCSVGFAGSGPSSGTCGLSGFLPGLWNTLVPSFRLAGLMILSCGTSRVSFLTVLGY